MSHSFKALTPILPSKDIAESVRFYSSLGFSQPWLWIKGGNRIHDMHTVDPIEYGGLDLPLEIHFVHVGIQAVLENTMLRIAVDGDMSALYEKCQALGVVHPTSKLELKPWGRLEFAVLDPSGICVYFYQDPA